MDTLKITGTLSAEADINGRLTAVQRLYGSLAPGNGEHDYYKGDYTVTPLAAAAQTLPTKEKLMLQDVIVEKVPFYETHNTYGGTTIYIAGSVFD